MKMTLKFNERSVLYLSIILLFAYTLVFAGLKGASYWRKNFGFERHVCNMYGLLQDIYYLSMLQNDKRIIDNYEAYNETDKSLGSWRMACLFVQYRIECCGSCYTDPAKNKWLEGGELFGKYWHPFKRWDEEPNYSCHHRFLCWNKNPFSPRYNDTNVMAIVGEGTAFETIQKIKNNYEYDFDSIIFGECRSAILLIEAVDSGVHWGEPGDFEIETVTKEQLFPGDTKGILVGFCNQEVWYIERTVPMETLKHFMTVESSKEHDREKELSPYGRKITTARGFVDSYKSE